MSKNRNWCFTINNPTEEEVPEGWTGVRYVIYQREIGNNGTEHFQGYVVWNNAISLVGCKSRNSRAHWEIRRGSHLQAKEYASKEDTRKEGCVPVEFGDEPSQGARSDLESVRTLLDSGGSMKDVAENHFGSFVRYYRGFQTYQLLTSCNRDWKTQVIVMVGAPGTGKSRWALEHLPNAYWKNHGIWWDGYLQHQLVVIDDFYGWLPYTEMLNLLDRYPLNVQTKGGTTSFLGRFIVLTSNKPPEDWYPRMARGALMRRIDHLWVFDEDGSVTVQKGLPQMLVSSQIVQLI